MATNLVVIKESQVVAPAPNTLQQTGAIISQGGTVTSLYTGSLITQPSDLTPLLTPAVAVSAASWASGVMTLTTSAHGIPVGQSVLMDWAGANFSVLNQTWLMTATTTTALTFSLVTNPGTVTTYGTVTNHSVAQLVAAVTTFFSMGYYQSIYVLEVGANGDTAAIASLSAYLTLFPNSAYKPGLTGYYYLYVVPKSWDGNAAFLTLSAAYQNLTSLTYFAVTTTLGTYTNYTSLMRNILWMIESPQFSAVPASVTVASASWAAGIVTLTVPAGNLIAAGSWFQLSGVTPTSLNGWQKAVTVTSTSISFAVAANPGTISAPGTILASYFANTGVPTTEFSMASMAWIILQWLPSDTNKVPQLEYTFTYGVTPFPQAGQSALLTTIQAAGGNYIGTGAEGGISNTMIVGGQTADGNSFNYWYAADWCKIQGDLQLANAIINGSNDPVNPLYYNQNGINSLEAVLAGVFSQAAIFGLVLFPPKQLGLTSAQLLAGLDAGTWQGYTVVNAIPFVPYSQSNPGDYRNRVYKGFSAQFTPQLGFDQIQINFIVSSFVAL